MAAYQVQLTFGYANSDSKRIYSFGVDSVDGAALVNKVKAINASIEGGTDGGLADFFRFDNNDAFSGITALKSIHNTPPSILSQEAIIMAKRSLILTSNQAGTNKKLQKTFTGISMAAGAQKLLNFTAKLNNMTTNAYVQTDCIDKFNVDTEIPPVDERQNQDIKLDESYFTLSNFNAGNFSQVTITGGDQPYAYALKNNVRMGFTENAGRLYFGKQDDGTLTGTFEIVVGLTGTEQYKPFEKRYTIE